MKDNNVDKLFREKIDHLSGLPENISWNKDIRLVAVSVTVSQRETLAKKNYHYSFISSCNVGNSSLYILKKPSFRKQNCY